MIKKIIIFLILIVAFTGVTYALMKQTGQKTGSSLISPIPSGYPSPTSSNPLLQGGTSFLDSKGVYTFLYPSDYKIDTQDEQTRISKVGATQKDKTELSDGVTLVFESIDLNGKPLEEWVDTNIEEMTSDGTVKVIKAKQPMILNTYPGFVYEIRGLGNYQYYVIQKDNNSKYAVVITSMVMDPENVGYQGKVNAILATLALYK